MTASEPLVIQMPPAGAQQLFLLFHGVGGTPHDLQVMGAQLAHAFPNAAVVAVPGPLPSDLGPGRQWFSVRGIDDQNRLQRVMEALPAFVDEIGHWQTRTGVPPSATALVGFSQGAILSLQASQRPELLAARVIAIGGRCASLPARMNAHCTVHLIHGQADAVMPPALAVAAAEHLVAVGADVTCDLLPQVGHAVTEAVVAQVLARLQGYIPLSRWREALAAQQAPGPSQG